MGGDRGAQSSGAWRNVSAARTGCAERILKVAIWISWRASTKAQLALESVAPKGGMRILQSIRSVNPEGGGVIEVVKQFSRVLESRGHDVTVASLDAPEDPWVKSFPHHLVPLGPAKAGYGVSPRFVPWLRERAGEFDAVIVNGIWQFNSFGVWRALRGTGKHYFVFPHGMLDPWFKRMYPLKHAKKWLYWPWAEYRVLRDAHAVLFTCEQEKALARESFWLYRANERVVPLGIARPAGDADAQREQFLDRFPELRGKRVLLFLGRIHEKKGCDLLLRAFAEVIAIDPDLTLVFAGPEQQDAGVCRELAKQQGVADRVVWTGMIGGDLKWGALRCAEVFVLPSHQENFGMAVVEALACGVPVLISREVNIWREIVAAGAGFADSDDVEGTMRILKRWFDLEAAEKHAMRQRAFECFSNSFEINHATDNLLAVLHNGNGMAHQLSKSAGAARRPGAAPAKARAKLDAGARHEKRTRAERIAAEILEEPEAPQFRVDLTRSKTRWPLKLLAARVAWACLVKPFFMMLPRPCGKLRIAILRAMGAKIGKGCHLEPRLKILLPWNLELGDHVAIGREVEFLNFAPVRIGAMTVVSQYSYLCTGTHDYTHPHFPLTFAPITIGSECWVAARSFVSPGVTIGNGSVVGASSVVIKNLPAWMVCAGNPCRPIKPREIKKVNP
jgi:glycosyltransferase involved in cell wall biosynthesis/acetyltransferase-like isoleucine patch superfamily enzyme